jgi:hypothetical protein
MAVGQLDGLIRAAGLLENLIETGHAGVGGAVFDIDRDVAILDEDPLDAPA